MRGFLFAQRGGTMKGQDVILLALLAVGAFIAFGPEPPGAVKWLLIIPFGALLGVYVALVHLAHLRRHEP
jgi:hypothetical protein